MRLSSFLLIALLLITSGCAFLPEQIDETSEWSANQLYVRAKKELADGNYEKAIDYFEKLEARYPFGQYAQQAQLEIAYAYYKYEEPELAITAADRFIKIYPRHPNVDYAWYIKGLTNYNRGKVFIDRYLPQEPAERDTFSMRQSYDDFSQLVQHYPHSIYAKDAAQRMIHLRNNMAEYEIHVADYYMRRTAYVAAANRGKYVIENFQRTPAVEDALVIMVRAYRKLAVNDLANGAMRVLQLNYPDSPDIAWLNDPRGYEVAKKGTGFWGSLNPWRSRDSSDVETVVKEEQPAFWEHWNLWTPDGKAPETVDKKQEPAGWQGWQQKKPATDEAEVEVKPAAAPQEETGEDAETETEGSSAEPGFWKDLIFWEQDPEDAETPETENSEEEPAFWEDWKFWEEEPEEAPAEE
jgi:outer membrane protein assembly factor BamD